MSITIGPKVKALLETTAVITAVPVVSAAINELNAYAGGAPFDPHALVVALASGAAIGLGYLTGVVRTLPDLSGSSADPATPVVPTPPAAS